MLKRLLFVVLLAIASAAQATVYSLPWGPKPQFVDANGAPMSSGTLQTFLATSSTPQVTYTDSTGGVANPTTITLNVRGETPNEVWLTGGVSYKFVLKDSSGSTVWTVDNVSGVNDVTSALSEWVSGPTPTFVSGTTFTLAGDQTQTFHIGRRVKTTNSGGTVYSTITNSVFGASTTVTIENDASVLDAGLSAVSYGLISQNNDSDPAFTDQAPVVVNKTDRTKRVRISVSGLTTSTTRVITAPDSNSIYGDYHGQSRLTKSGANLLLSPFNGNKLIINSVLQAIPDAGVTLAIGAAVANTTYYIYAFMSAGVMTLEFSTTAHSAQAGTGVEIKTGDATRTLVGMARANASPAWADSAAQRFVVSYFNRRNIGVVSAFTAGRSTASASYVELNTEIRNEFLTWADEAVLVTSNGGISASDATSGASSIGFDGITAEETYATGFVGGVVNAGTMPYALSLSKNGLAEGYHYATLLGKAAAGTPSWAGTGTAGTRCNLSVMVRG